MSRVRDLVSGQTLNLLLFGCFWAGYCALGAAVASTTVMQRGDNMFFHDAPRIVMDITSPGYNHLRTAVHPLYVLFFNPFGTALRLVTGSHTAAALIVNSFFGALCVVFARLFFTSAGFGDSRATAYALLLGVSASHMFFGSVPSTGIMGAAAIIAGFIVAVKRPGNLKWFVPAGVVSMGVTTTNIVHTLAAYGASLRPGNSFMSVFKKSLILIVLVVVVLLPLNVVQKGVYPSSKVIFLPRSYEHDVPYMAPFRTVGELGRRVYKLVGHVFL